MTKKKMVKLNDPCETPTNLKLFLEERLEESNELRVTQHIAECNRCQSVLASFVAGPAEWEDLRNNLSDFPLDGCTKTESAFSHQRSVDYEKQVVGLLAPTDDPEMLGRLARYEVCGVIGAGSMGVVLKALDPSLGRYVAIKILAPALATSGLARKRFAREGRAIAAVRCAHVVQIHGVGEFLGTPYIVMQYLPGGTLQNRIENQGDLTTREVCRIGMQVATGLAAAHQQGIIHRDIKPANVLIQEGLECAIVTDFGLARVIDEATMTHTGSISGTPQFMSPEQAKGESVDERTDLFSLGSVMYMACTGRPPFRGETLVGVVNRVCAHEPCQIRELNPDIDQWLASFIGKLMAKDHSERFASAGEVAKLLEVELAYLQNPTNLAEPARDWLPKEAASGWMRVSKRSITTAILLALVVGAGIVAIQSFEPLRTAVLGVQAPALSKIKANAIRPTESELAFFEARAAYDLAHETHLMEQRLRGDMTQAIERHGRALKLGYNKAVSSFNLARAYAFQGSLDESFQWLETAINAGFHDTVELTTSPDFTKIRTDSRYRPIVKLCRELEERFRIADQLYFRDEDYPSAEQQYRLLLRTCPDCELCITMLAGSLLHQEKLKEAAVWNVRVRNTVQYAYLGSYNLGCIAALQEDTELALAYLKHAVDSGFTDVMHLKKDKQLVGLRGMPEFRELVSHMENRQILSQRKRQ